MTRAATISLMRAMVADMRLTTSRTIDLIDESRATLAVANDLLVRSISGRAQHR